MRLSFENRESLIKKEAVGSLCLSFNNPQNDSEYSASGKVVVVCHPRARRGAKIIKDTTSFASRPAGSRK